MRKLFAALRIRASTLRYPQKFVLISLLFTAPLLAFYPLLAQHVTRIDRFGTGELSGALYLRPLQHLLQDVGLHQIVVTEYLTEQATSGDLTLAQTRIRSDFEALERVDQQYGAAWRSSEQAAALREQWETLKAEATTLTPENSTDRHAELMAAVRAFIAQIGAASSLTLDPDLDTYYMMNLVLRQSPENHRLLMDLLTIGEKGLRQGQMTANDFTQATILRNDLRASLEAMRADVDTALQSNTAGTMRPLVERPFEAAAAAQQQFLDIVDQALLIRRTSIDLADWEPFMAAARAALDANAALDDAASQALEVGVRARRDSQNQTLIVSLGIASVSIGVAFAIGLSLMVTVSRPLGSLAIATQRLIAGDMSVRVDVTGQDEVGQVGVAFNRIAEELDSVRAALEARTAQLQTSNDVGRAIALILDPAVLLREVVNLITDRFGFYYAAVFTVDDNGKFAVLREASGQAGKILKERGHRLELGGHSMVAYSIAKRASRIALDVGADAVRFANPLLPRTRSEIALPLLVGERVLGVLDVQSTQEAAFDAVSAATLQAVADQIAIALNDAALYAESQRNIEALNGLLSLTNDIARSRSLVDLTSRAMEHIQVLLGVENYYMALADEQRTEVRFVLERRSDNVVHDTTNTRPFGNGRTEYVIRTRRPLRMDADEAPARLEQLELTTSESKPGAFLGIPILIGDRVLGMIGLQDLDPGAAFTDAQERLATTLAGQLAVTLDNLRLAEETQRAFADLDAANRLLTGQAWERYVRRSGSFASEWHSGDWTPIAAAQYENHLPNPAQLLRVPLKVRGETIGEFDLLPADEREWLPEEMAFAQSLVDQVGQVIETARLLEETERLAGRERLINAINTRVRQTVNMDSILRTAVDELGRSLKAARVFAQIGHAGEIGNGHDRTKEKSDEV
ncbi:MAG TPA: GAF domain-containing protein [Anaerolineae bacterium]|nr:GAF domain-containing protein [Anaerolineae bacterium]